MVQGQGRQVVKQGPESVHGMDILGFPDSAFFVWPNPRLLYREAIVILNSI